MQWPSNGEHRMNRSEFDKLGTPMTVPVDIKPKQVFVLINQDVANNAEKYFWELPLDGTFKVTYEEVESTRKLNQNAALWAVAYPPIMESIGLRGEKEREEIHEYFCGEYWGWQHINILGKMKARPIRTTTTNEEGKREVISKSAMYDFYSFIQQRAAENGIFVPDPDPMYGINR